MSDVLRGWRLTEKGRCYVDEIIIRFKAGDTIEQIAAAMGLPEGAVQMLIALELKESS